MRAIRGLWRWRRNPLRRSTDLAESRLALAALLLMVVVTPLIGTAVGHLAQDSLHRTVREQHRARHLVTATVVRKLSRSPLDTDPDTSSSRDLRSRVIADWTAPDGTFQHGPTLSDLKSPHRGDRFAMWTDAHGRTVARPLDSATASTHAVLAGVGAALLTAGVVEVARRLLVWRMVRRRYVSWDQAWEQAGPDWGRTGTGS
ncbi:hypothetical protein ACIQOU_02030 [Streptomyces sp. NPDC091279]|uniref:Rv1733c family protein n=1 Tax=unclassified Streptomyces TaxID=2593676 RepID=UPI00381970FA